MTDLRDMVRRGRAARLELYHRIADRSAAVLRILIVVGVVWWFTHDMSAADWRDAGIAVLAWLGGGARGLLRGLIVRAFGGRV